jgi:hypothetical protein
MTTTAVAGQYLLIRRLISRPDQLTFYLCWAPPGRPVTMTYFITMAGRRWPAEETFKTGKDVLGWDQTQARTWNAICRHTALAALAQLRAAAIRSALSGSIALPAVSQDTSPATDDTRISDADLQILLGDAPVPARGGQPCPPGPAAVHRRTSQHPRGRPGARPLASHPLRSSRPARTRLRRADHQPRPPPRGHRDPGSARPATLPASPRLPQPDDGKLQANHARCPVSRKSALSQGFPVHQRAGLN